MGVATTSFVDAPPLDAAGARRRGRDTYGFVEKCHAFRAGGIQAQWNRDVAKLRTRAEELGMWVEGMAGVPETAIWRRWKSRCWMPRKQG